MEGQVAALNKQEPVMEGQVAVLNKQVPAMEGQVAALNKQEPIKPWIWQKNNLTFAYMLSFAVFFLIGLYFAQSDKK